MTALSSIGTFVRGKGISKGQITKGDGLPCIRYGEIYTSYGDVAHELISRVSKKNAESSFAIHTGDILFPTSGETVDEIGKAVAYLGTRTAYASSDILILRDHGQNPAFLAYVLNEWHAVKQKAKLATGHSVVHLYASELGQVKIFLPPLAEQERIAEILSDADAAIALAEKQIQTFLRQRKGLIEKLFAGIWDKSQWKTMPFGSLIRTVSPLRHQLPKELYQSKGAVPVIDQGKDFFSGWTNNTSLTLSRPHGVIIFGDHTRIVKFYIGDFVVGADGTKLLEPSSSNMSIQFLAYLTELCSSRMTNLGYSRHFKELKELRCPIPPLTQQKQIVEILSSVDAAIAIVEKQKETSKKQKQGLMQKLLTGQWRTKDV